MRDARESRGLSLAEVAARTRVPQRHLEALEAGEYGALPSPTYAMGFSKAYARAVGADEVAIAQDVRRELDRLGPRQPEYVPYETADPARVPSRGLAIVGVGIALAVLILVGLWYGTDLFRPQGVTPGASDAVVAQAVAPRPTPAATPAAPTGGQVVLTANDEVWLRVYDADNKTLYLGTMKPGEKFEVPANANDPQINVGRPDKLAVTLNGSAIPPLGDGSRPIKDVRVSGTAIAARLAGQPAPSASASPTATPSSSRTGGRTASRTGGSRSGRSESRPALTETQRANLQASQEPAATGNSSAP
ncbi:helix-turn-helix domain-containing protein [Sphingomonas sp. RP10(2022)]|uniref:Helix-turn-helix domain-containing protein n=1 Tax=Sphingomonas liriopis TaxID=2949094 RepID=A0A9X2KPK9_9SPHN|nr:helix-turn-helix domain-containing protein [Sphingomonas liriopis]MCP3733992.1 helix-turn-helix domain-containing protein [Sphingomonas liriopis]